MRRLLRVFSIATYPEFLSCLFCLQIFSSVTATLSHQIISCIDGDKVSFLTSILKTENVTFSFLAESQIYCVTGPLDDIIKCQNCLKTCMTSLSLGLPASNVYESLGSNVNTDAKGDVNEVQTVASTSIGTGINSVNSESTIETFPSEDAAEIGDSNSVKVERGVNCEILTTPVVTKSGRVVKRKVPWVSDFVPVDVEEGSVRSASVQQVKKTRSSVSKSGKKRGRQKKVRAGKPRTGSSLTDKLVRGKHDVKSQDIIKQTETSSTPSGAPVLKQKLRNDTKSSESLNENGTDVLDVSVKELADQDELGDKTISPNTAGKDDENTTDLQHYDMVNTVNESLPVNDTENISPEKGLSQRLDKIGEDLVAKAKRSMKRTGNDKKEDVDILAVLKKQKQVYEKEMPYKYYCSKCSYKSKRKSHFDKHKKLHIRDPDALLHKCEQCEFTTIRQSVLQKHMISHAQNLLYCQSCAYQTHNPIFLSNHMKTRHSRSSTDRNGSKMIDEKFYCNVCSFSTKKMSLFNRHYKNHSINFIRSEDGKAIYTCDLCVYMTQQKDHFLRHKRNVHGNLRPYLCDTCGMSFKRVDALKAHQFTHLDRSQRSLPFLCSTCNKAFKSRVSIRLEMH